MCAATNKLLIDIEIKKLKEFQMDMLAYIDNAYPEIGREIEEKKVLTDELTAKILEAVKSFKNQSR